MEYPVEQVWRVGRVTLQPVTKLFTRLRAYGVGRIPPTGGVVLAVNHLSWVDTVSFGAACPRTIYFIAKAEAYEVPGLAQLIRAFGAFPVRRGASDREAVRAMRGFVREGKALGVFVEGTRQRSGVPGKALPGAAMVALQEDVPVVPGAVYGSSAWRVGNFRPVSVAWGEPVSFDGLARGGRGYREATFELERRIHALWAWLGDIDRLGRPDGVPPA